jgi:ribosomal protein S15P/S13E
MPVIVTKEAKQEIFKTHGGLLPTRARSEGQIALFTARIEHLTAAPEEQQEGPPLRKRRCWTW